MAILTAFLALLLLTAQANAHMWLRTPVSQGGLSFAGGTGGPCAGKALGSGQRTTFEVGDKVTFQFRVNQHGPNPFQFALATTGTDFSVLLGDKVANTVTAGPDGFDGVNVEITIPNNPCESCTIQLSGMGQTDGSGTWYNCADVKIVPSGSLNIPKPSSLSPSSGPTAGGTTLTVTGTNFGTSSTGQAKCSFDDTIVDATWLSSTQISCLSPPRNNPGQAAVEVSLNGTYFSATGTVYNYTGSVILPQISSISPKKGRVGSTITIKGKNFYSSAMQCKFGTTATKATVTSSTEASCVVPNLGAEYENVAVEVSVDNSPYSQSGETFRIVAVTGSTGLTSGGVAGIVIGVLVIVGILAAVAVLYVKGKISFKTEIIPPNWGKSRV